MRELVHAKLTTARVREGRFASPDDYGHTGAFILFGPTGAQLKIVASDASTPASRGWEHVSVSVHNRCPNWPEMCFVKDLFWDPEETVFQLHPPRSAWVNNHRFCLHLWRNGTLIFPMPPSIFVGIAEEGEIRDRAHAEAIRRKYEGVDILNLKGKN